MLAPKVVAVLCPSARDKPTAGNGGALVRFAGRLRVWRSAGFEPKLCTPQTCSWMNNGCKESCRRSRLNGSQQRRTTSSSKQPWSRSESLVVAGAVSICRHDRACNQVSNLSTKCRQPVEQSTNKLPGNCCTDTCYGTRWTVAHAYRSCSIVSQPLLYGF